MIFRRCAWAILSLLAAAQAYSARHQMNVDGVAYLDVADTYRRGDWQWAINGHWSPMYSWLLGAADAILQPTPYWEFAVAHLVNVTIFIAALAAFEFLLREIIHLQKKTEASGESMSLPVWAWYALGYSLFAWASLKGVTLVLVTPDLLVSAILYLSLAILLRIRRGAAGLPAAAALGAALGFGFLAKAPMLPISLIVLSLAAAAMPPRRRWTGLATAIGTFLVVAAPFIIALSSAKGRVTFGESRIISYAWLVHDVPLRHWRGDARNVLSHQTRQLLEDPPLYEFGNPVPGTYPVWYDPSYWYEGLNPPFSFRAQTRAVFQAVHEYYSLMFVGPLASLVFGVLVLWSLSQPRASVQAALAQWPLLVPAVGGLAMFGLVRVFPRYVAPFLVIFWLAALASVRMRKTYETARLVRAISAVMVILMLAPMVPSTAANLATATVDLADGERPTEHPPWLVADALHRIGVQRGHAVAVIHSDGSSSWSGMAGWARAAGVKVVAEVLPEDAGRYWGASPEVRKHVTDQIVRTGARVVVSPRPAAAAGPGWQPLGDTAYSALILNPRDEAVKAAAKKPFASE
jgi:hypothetical protein